MTVLLGCEAERQSATSLPESSTSRPGPSAEVKEASRGRGSSARAVASATTPKSTTRNDLEGPCEPTPGQPTSSPGMIVETINYGRYFIRNNLKQTLHAAGVDRGGVTPRTLDIPPGETIEVWRVYEASGGHVRPTNFFASISITSGAGGATVYSGVRNDDWKDVGDDGCGASRYLLTLDRPVP